LCKPEVVNLARVHARSKVLAVDNSSPQDTYARDTDTDKLRSLELILILVMILTLTNYGV